MRNGPTIYDIAREAKVGIATVSRVLNGDPHVRPHTRQLIRSTMVALEYRPNRAARRLANGHVSRPRVAVLLPFFTAAFYYTVTRALSQDLDADDTDLVLFDIKDRDDKQRILDRLMSERTCEGIVFVSCTVGQERRCMLERLGIAALCVDRSDDHLPWVGIDNRLGGRMAAEHLAECGCRRLAMIGGPEKAHSLNERAEGFRSVSSLQTPVIRARSVEREAAKVAMADLLEEHRDLDGIACVNDVLAIGAMEALAERGLRVPDDVQLIGFDDQPLMDFIGLTTIAQPMARFGHWAGTEIRKMIQDPTYRPASKLMPITLIRRLTTRKEPT